MLNVYISSSGMEDGSELIEGVFATRQMAVDCTEKLIRERHKLPEEVSVSKEGDQIVWSTTYGWFYTVTEHEVIGGSDD